MISPQPMHHWRAVAGFTVALLVGWVAAWQHGRDDLAAPLSRRAAMPTSSRPIETERQGSPAPRTPAALLWETHAPERGRTWAQQWRAQRDDAFADRRAMRAGLVARGTSLVTDVAAFLRDDADLRTLPEQTVLAQARPTIILDRMAAIDLLEALATPDAESDEVQTAAQDVLDERVRATESAPSETLAWRVQRAERYDALVAIAHVNPTRALQRYVELEDELLVQVLHPALLMALLDIGMSQSEAVETLQAARPN